MSATKMIGCHRCGNNHGELYDEHGMPWPCPSCSGSQAPPPPPPTFSPSYCLFAFAKNCGGGEGKIPACRACRLYKYRILSLARMI